MPSRPRVPPIPYLVLVPALLASATAGGAPKAEAPRPLAGAAPRVPPSARPTVAATFAHESYSPGETAQLIIRSRAHDVRIQFFRAGTERRRIASRDTMLGSAVVRARRIGDVSRVRIVRSRLGTWPSGLYFARITAAGGRIGFAPFILRPQSIGEHRVAVVLPTRTWQAYNFSDDDRDGKADTWYAGGATARLARPHENRGVPPNYRRYDQPFLRWLDERGARVDYLAQSDVGRIADARILGRAYDLIVFPGHHEYVTAREYDTIVAYRNSGGNLMFLSANNFFWKIEVRGSVMTRVRLWRELGRPESALVGVQYFGNDRGTYKAWWIVRDATAADGLLDAVGLARGAQLARGGVEVDATTSHSPRGTKVLAELRWRNGRYAQMTYYETATHAKVFAAGAFELVSSIHQRNVSRLMDELWRRLTLP